MTEYITSDRIANSIMQKNLEHNYLIVEGKSDYALFKKFIDSNACSIEIGFGNQNVIDVISELKKREFNRAIGIIDSDFRILDQVEQIEDVLTTDFHDIEISMINSSSFETVLLNYIKPNKLQKHYENLDDFRNHLFSLTSDLGYLKWLNSIENYGLIFKPKNPEGNKINYSLFICINELKYLGEDKLIDSIFNFCNGKVKIDVTKEKLKEKLNEFKKEVDINQLCNGHDIMNVICLSLKKHISNSNSISSEQLEKEFSLAYESRYFMTTNLYEQIKETEIIKELNFLSF